MPTMVLLWVWCCAYLNCAGWTLSALHQLNAGGYAVVLALGVVALWVWRRQNAPQILPKIRWQKKIRRFRKPFPLAFLILAVMVFLGGAIYPPTNYDALSYRVPRVLHWLAAGQWHWIHTIFPRLNQRCCGIEWVSAPFLALLKTDRPLFLINFTSFLFLPGLVFSVFTRLGVRRRVMWYWMWLVPTGYCYLLQAGSIGNDLFGAVFVLAAMDFALRAKISGSARDFFTSVLAAALMTSAKPSNLPLLLPWALAMLPSLGLIWRRPVRTAAVGVIALAASYVPSAALNWHYCGDWTGLKVETGVTAAGPAFLTVANTFLLGIQNFDPPLFPFTGWWHDFFAQHLPSALSVKLEHTMEAGLRAFDLSMLQIEERAGLGFGVCSLLLASLVAARFACPKISPMRPSLWLQAVRWSPVFSLWVLICHSWVEAISREITPYYALLLPLLLARPGHAWLVSRRWWRWWALPVFIMAAGLLVISPARPLFPVQRLLDSSSLSARARTVYSVYQSRHDVFAPVFAVLPADLKVLGLVAYDDPEASLWRPFGSRRIEHVCPGDTAVDLKARGVDYVLLQEETFVALFDCPLAVWQQRMNAEVVGKVTLSLRASAGPLEWTILRLPPAEPGSPNHP
jgi:hypothetical protein